MAPKDCLDYALARWTPIARFPNWPDTKFWGEQVRYWREYIAKATSPQAR